ncbi:MAG: DUF262 domain-containing protein [Treponema sp.]|nr:DUF262 domain-containing protein [Treponema sp.]
MLEKYTLKTLINSDFRIVVPRVQRDYAQGRVGKFEDRVRKRFLDALYSAVVNHQSVTLDFVYGDVEEDGKLILLDGQQRMTTLFLLHWYAAKKEKLHKNEYEFLKNFSYATRFSSRDFCKAIIENEISFESSKLSEEIKNQSWYPYDWKNDPTIQSMLVMIDAINKKFSNVGNLWKSLVQDDCVSFYFLPLKEMGLSDELYIKMNSRGKPLTDFEHFKAEFLELIKEQNEELYKEFSRKIDIDWTDMLFAYRGENQIIDDEFMRYFKYVSHILSYKTLIKSREDSIESDEFKLAKLLYSSENPESIRNLEFLKAAFDCWCGIDIENFFNSIFYTNAYEKGKIKLYLKGNEKLNLFLNCCSYHGESSENGRNRLFSLNSMLLFYAVLVYRLNSNSISEESFRRRIRIIRNLTENSQYEIREFDQYGNNQMQRLLDDVDEIIKNGNVITEDRGFNILQKEEEKRKLEWLSDNLPYKDELFQLEDNALLRGTVSIIGLENPDNFSKFSVLFEQCNKDLINRALLCIGDYSQNLGWRTQLGVESRDSVWSDLFHPTKQRNDGGRFSNTAKILNHLLSGIPKDCTDYSEILEKSISDYLSKENLVFDWRYYFIKYKEMRYDSYGMYWWNDKIKKPYEVLIMHTEKALNGRNWNVFAYTIFKMHPERFELENYAYKGDKLRIKGKNISVEIFNDRFVIFEGENQPEEFIIEQQDGIDKEDRISVIYEKLANCFLMEEEKI